jgi:putative RNA 2'-phosphotransferase
MDQKTTIRVSKFLSYVLRHAPDDIGLTLDENGWADVTELLECSARHGTRISRDELNHVVATNDKKRFAFDETKSRIRANQGHSVEVDLGLVARTPPDILYHGTAERSVPAILASGLQKQSRQHVHLSLTFEQAVTVGRRHGKPVVLKVDARAMHAAGLSLYMAENSVWLADEVPPAYLSVIPRPHA